MVINDKAGLEVVCAKMDRVIKTVVDMPDYVRAVLFNELGHKFCLECGQFQPCYCSDELNSCIPKEYDI